MGECSKINLSDTVRNPDGCQILTLSKCRLADVGKCIGKGHRLQLAVAECPVSNCSNGQTAQSGRNDQIRFLTGITHDLAGFRIDGRIQQHRFLIQHFCGIYCRIQFFRLSAFHFNFSHRDGNRFTNNFLAGCFPVLAQTCCEGNDIQQAGTAQHQQRQEKCKYSSHKNTPNIQILYFE